MNWHQVVIAASAAAWISAARRGRIFARSNVLRISAVSKTAQRASQAARFAHHQAPLCGAINKQTAARQRGAARGIAIAAAGRRTLASRIAASAAPRHQTSRASRAAARGGARKAWRVRARWRHGMAKEKSRVGAAGGGGGRWRSGINAGGMPGDGVARKRQRRRRAAAARAAKRHLLASFSRRQCVATCRRRSTTLHNGVATRVFAADEEKTGWQQTACRLRRCVFHRGRQRTRRKACSSVITRGMACSIGMATLQNARGVPLTRRVAGLSTYYACAALAAGDAPHAGKRRVYRCWQTRRTDRHRIAPARIAPLGSFCGTLYGAVLLHNAGRQGERGMNADVKYSAAWQKHGAAAHVAYRTTAHCTRIAAPAAGYRAACCGAISAKPPGASWRHRVAHRK